MRTSFGHAWWHRVVLGKSFPSPFIQKLFSYTCAQHGRYSHGAQMVIVALLRLCRCALKFVSKLCLHVCAETCQVTSRLACLFKS